ncbi:NPC intracellular cholesterol transporter 2-like [Wyeomyia smithii]|uniref:NPC intracellular cholesterol transporter 2-like n=1 Tax=Wyeomyia smithii TaxID=174621 RepID=UPI002467C118|nr:NPC intracellular cholesterol transporter 2-like [Wyeomyia smithii]
MREYLLVAVLLPALVLGQTPIMSCPNGAPVPREVDLNGCTTAPCNIPAGAPIVAHAKGIVSPVATETLTAHISIRLLGLEIPFPIPESLVDACAAGTEPGTCPVSAGQEFDYTLNYEGDPPPVSGVTVQIEVGLAADDGSDVTCVAVDVYISN